MPLEGITIFCFAASYAVALGLDILQLLRPGPGWHCLPAPPAVDRGTRDRRAGKQWHTLVMHGFLGAGIFAHAIYLINHGLPLSGGSSSLLFLSWILAVFGFYGSIHHRGVAWGIFVLPVVLGLVLIAWLAPERVTPATPLTAPHLAGWIWLHTVLLVLGAVGLCVSFVASIMYLVQSAKLKRKVPPSEGLRLLSLERLEEMSRRGINLAFPLFTGGLLIGLALMWSTQQLPWYDVKVLSTAALWLVFVLLLYLRYGLNLSGRRVALWTIAAFGILVLAFALHLILPSSHHFGGGS